MNFDEYYYCVYEICYDINKCNFDMNKKQKRKLLLHLSWTLTCLEHCTDETKNDKQNRYNKCNTIKFFDSFF